MGIYIFRRNVLKELLEDVSMMDFGKDIIPEAIKKYKVFSYAFQGYWEDVGTIKAYFDANISFGARIRLSISMTKTLQFIRMFVIYRHRKLKKQILIQA